MRFLLLLEKVLLLLGATWLTAQTLVWFQIDLLSTFVGALVGAISSCLTAQSKLIKNAFIKEAFSPSRTVQLFLWVVTIIGLAYVMQ